MSFLTEYVAYLLNRLSQGEDGKVPYERIRAKKLIIFGLEFGEKLMYKKATQARRTALDGP